MSLIDWICGIKKTDAKDPNDYTKTKLSTHWDYSPHYCPQCKKDTCHSDYMADICSHCGRLGAQTRYGRSYRQIYIKGFWHYQIIYKNSKEEIRIDWY